MNFKQLETDILSELKKRVASKRLGHIISVSKTAEKLALHFNLDSQRHKILGLLHDLCKEDDNQSQKELLQVKFPKDQTLLANSALYHAKTSFFKSQELFGLTADYLSPILWHTTGKAQMSVDDKILYVADYIEPLRTWHDKTFMKQAIESIDALILKILSHKIKYTIDSGKQVHPDSIHCYNFMIAGQ
ncbi:MAG: bis(5'-nucleosyl)-tetraphosphatase (symmetrical) YqeK [Candidatus Cloacimonetes bacterium]|nr:bis(5'-nucleosyl)-tetraphosphatase (symmetrical) YqeK [Candidatus Cloacimonadota bacterium]